MINIYICTVRVHLYFFHTTKSHQLYNNITLPIIVCFAVCYNDDDDDDDDDDDEQQKQNKKA